MRLGRADEALDLLLQCQQVFRATSDTKALGMVLSALADAEDARAHGDSTIGLERDALRYKYLSGDVPGIAASYHNLGNYLAVHARQPAAALASHLAAALIRALAESGGSGSVAAAAFRRELGPSVTPPADVPDLSRLIGDIPGTDLAGLIARLSPDQAAAEYALDQLVQAMNIQGSPPESAVSGPGSSSPGTASPGTASPGVSTPGFIKFTSIRPTSARVQDPVSSPVPVNQFVTILPQAYRRPPDRPNIAHVVTLQDSALFDSPPERHPKTRSHAPSGISGNSTRRPAPPGTTRQQRTDQPASCALDDDGRGAVGGTERVRWFAARPVIRYQPFVARLVGCPVACIGALCGRLPVVKPAHRGQSACALMRCRLPGRRPG